MKSGNSERKSIASIFFVVIMVASVFVTITSVSANPAAIYFGDLYGSTYAEFGPNQAIVIAGFIDYTTGCPPGGIDDFIYPWADIYIVPDGAVSGHGTSPLSDVSGAPNTVQGASGGMFINEIIGYTVPGGSIGVGAYDIVVDNCQDGEFNEGWDYILGMDDQVAFRVIIPADVPILPDASISAAKASAEQQYHHWREAHKHFSALLDPVDAYGYIGILTDPASLLVWLLETSISEALGVDPGAIAKQELVNTYSHYRGLWVDPPDPNYKSITTLEAISPIDPLSNDTLTVAAAGMGNAVATEGAVVKALLHSIERYQGARATGDGEWALIHARAIKNYADLLASQLSETNTALVAMSAAITADTRPVEAMAIDLEAARERVDASGFSSDEIREARNLGMADAEIDGFRDDFIARDYSGFSKANLVAVLSDVINNNTEAVTDYQNLSAAMDDVIAYLLPQPGVLERTPTAEANGPYSGTEGVPLMLDGSGSTDPNGDTLTYEWDLDGDGEFDDATGAAPSVTFNSAFEGLIGLKVTNTAGFFNVDYAHVSIANVNSPPSIDAFSPPERNLLVIVGSLQDFSVTTSDPDGDSVSVDWFLNPLVGTGPTFTYTPTEADVGTHILRTIATDDSPLGGSVAMKWVVTVLMPDGDGDGWRANVDCNDADPNVNPGATEIIGNGIDDDCNPATPDTGMPPTAAFSPVMEMNVAQLEDGASIVNFSSVYSGYQPENAIDANTYTAWYTGSGQTTDQWIKVQLTGDQLHIVDRVVVMGSITFGYGLKDFEVRVSTTGTDDADFTTVFSGTVPQDNELHEFTFSPVHAMYVQLFVVNNWGYEYYTLVSHFQVWTRSREGGVVSMLGGPPASIAGFSSQSSTSYAPENMIDDSNITYWQTPKAEQTTDQWVKVELGGGLTYTIDRVRLKSLYTGYGVKDFEIRVSTTTADDSAFTTVFSGTADDDTTLQEFAFPPVQARYVQLFVKNNYGRYSVCVNTFQVMTPDGANVARLEGVGAFVVGYSSQYSASYSPEKAIDFSDSTFWWSASGQITDQWIKVRLIEGAPYLVDRVMLKGPGNTYAPRDFEIRVSNATLDDADFVTVFNDTLPMDRLSHWFTFPALEAKYVQLFIRDNHGSTAYILVNDFKVYSPRLGGATVPFDDFSVDPDGQVVAWSWDFGDGTTSTEQHPVHIYTAPNTYIIRQTVTDNDGLSNTATMQYTVLRPPTADFTWSPATPNEGESTHFTDASTDADGSIVGWRWQFTHSTYEPTSQTTVMWFPDNGEYPVTLTVTDSQLLTATVTKTVTVLNLPPYVGAGPDQTVVWGQDWNIGSWVGDRGSGDRSSLVADWDFGDGETAQVLNCSTGTVRVAHAYANPGTYTAILTVTDKDDASSSDSLVVTVNRRDSFVKVYGTMSAIASGEVEVVAKLWDGFDVRTPTPNRTVTLTWDSQTVNAITNAEGVATAVLTSAAGGEENTVSASFVGDSFYHGSTDTDVVKAASTLPPGDIVFIIDESGSMSQDIAEVRARVTDIANQLGASVDFQLGLVGFGDGGAGHPTFLDQALTFGSQAHIHTPLTDDVGMFTNGVDELVASGRVEPGFSAVVLGMSPAMGYFRPDCGVCAVLISDEEATYNIFDQAPETKADALAALNSRNAIFLAIVDPNYCDDDYGPNPGSLSEATGGQVFDILDFRANPEPVLTAILDKCIQRIIEEANDPPVAVDDAYSVDENTTFAVAAPGVLANDSDVDGDPLTAVLVSGTSNGTLSLNADGSFTYAPYANFYGSDSFTYKASDGSLDSNVATVTITVTRANQPPVADPNGPYTDTEGVLITFDGSGSYDPDGTIDTYEWDFGDGSTGTGVSPTHTYAQNGTYTVTLTVTDNDGATDTNTTTATIEDTEPTADFTGTPTSGSKPLTVDFTDASTSYDGITAREWDFDNDGAIDSTEQNPTHVYSEDGTYTVTLTVYEADGDSDTETKVDYITVTIVNQPPVSDPNGPYTGQVGVLVTLDGSGSYDPDPAPDHIVTWEWDLDNDGYYDDATGEIVSYTWNTEGTYTISLKVTDTLGATGTNSTTVDITAVKVNIPPKPIITEPKEGETISCTHVKIVEIEETDATDIVYNLFEYSTDGITWNEIGNDTDPSDGWSVEWDTTTVPVGDYFIRATMGDTGGLTGSDTINVMVVRPEGGIGVAVLPKVSTVTSGTNASLNIKVVSTENFDDIFHAYLTTDGIPPAYQADLTWFNWTSKEVWIESGGQAVIPLNVSIPGGASGYKGFRAVAESTRCAPVQYDTGILNIS